MKNFNEKDFQSTLKQTPWDTAFVFEDMDDVLGTWEGMFNEALDAHCPWRTKKVVHANQTPWITKGVIKQLRNRDKLLKTARRSNTEADWALYRTERNKAVNMIKSARSKYYKNCFEQKSGDSRAMWKTIKSLSGLRNKGQAKCGVVNDDQSAADKFNQHFVSIADKLRSLLKKVPIDFTRLKNFVRSRKDPDVKFNIPPVTKAFALDTLLSLSPNKATGVDKISARMLKIAAPIIAPSLCKLMNCSIRAGVFPQRWKTAKVRPLFKSGDRSDVNNYRPISVLPVISKLLERHVHSAFYAYLRDNNLLYVGQSGFREYHSAETSLISLMDKLLFNLDNNRVTGMVLIDYCKAFDMVDHPILLEKWFRSYLSERQQMVLVDGHASDCAIVPHGIPQGSILGPLLFVVFINDLPLHTQSCGDVHLELYADDTTLTASADITKCDGLNLTLTNALHEVEHWANANKLPLNEKKTKTLLITGKRLHDKLEPSSRNLGVQTSSGHSLLQEPSAKVLGLEIDSELSFSTHVDSICKKLASRIGILNKIKINLPLSQRILFYNSITRPIFNYVNAAWLERSSKENVIRLLRLQKRAARIILDAGPWSPSVPLFNRLKWLPYYQECEIAKCSLVFKRINNEVPQYISERLTLNSERHSRTTRYCNLNFICPRFNRKTEGGSTFSVTTTTLWNSLPITIRQSSSAMALRNSLRKRFLAGQKFLRHFCP